MVHYGALVPGSLHLDYGFCWAHFGTGFHLVQVLFQGERRLGLVQGGGLSWSLTNARFCDIDLAGLNEVEVLLIKAIWVRD